MKIGSVEVGPTQPPLFIAEAGVNHNGDLSTAKELIDVAADAGADVVKFQTFSADRLVTPDAGKAEYQIELSGDGSQYEMLKRYELDREAHEVLIEYCNKRNIMFLSTPFDLESADMLYDLGVDAIKIGSGDLDNIPLLQHVAQFKIPLIVSTGMASMEEVIEAHDAIHTSSPSVESIFLHCISSYPCSLDDVNLRAMQTIRDELETIVGFSDHTTIPETPALAVSAGACVVEKHFTLDSELSGPDHRASLEPDELKQAISLVEVAHRVLGTAVKEPTSIELKNRDVVRKSVHAAVDIPEGTKIEAEHLVILRPADGIPPNRYDDVLGSIAKRDVPRGEAITADSIKYT